MAKKFPPCLVRVPPDRLIVPLLLPLARPTASQLLVVKDAESWMLRMPMPPAWPTQNSPAVSLKTALLRTVMVLVTALVDSPTKALPLPDLVTEALPEMSRVPNAPPRPTTSQLLTVRTEVSLRLAVALLPPPLANQISPLTRNWALLRRVKLLSWALSPTGTLPPPVLLNTPPEMSTVPLPPSRPMTN